MNAPFEVDGGFVAEGGMAPAGIVPALDELKDGDAGLRLGLELSPVEQLTFEGGEEAFTHGVVISIADRSHGRTYLSFLAAQTEGHGGAGSVQNLSHFSSRWLIWSGDHLLLR